MARRLKCFTASFGGVICHIQVRPSSTARDSQIARPWAQDGAAIRPVVDESGGRVLLLAPTEAGAVAAAQRFLTRRFGAIGVRVRECPAPERHVKREGAPVRWGDDVNRSAG